MGLYINNKKGDQTQLSQIKITYIGQTAILINYENLYSIFCTQQVTFIVSNNGNNRDLLSAFPEHDQCAVHLHEMVTNIKKWRQNI